MRRFLPSALALVLAGCSGGGTAPAVVATTPVVPAAKIVVPSFTLVVSRPASSASVKRDPNYVSINTGSVTVALTPPVPGLVPSSVTTTIDPTKCPCTVAGPPAPPGVSDTFTLSAYQTSTSTVPLSVGTATLTPVAGANNSANVTLLGVPVSIALGNASSAASTPSTSTFGGPRAVDASGAQITGTFFAPIEVTSTDTSGPLGVQLGGTNATCGASGCTATLATGSDSVSFVYGGLAEAAQSIVTTGGTNFTGATYTVTPLLQPIVRSGGSTSVYSGAPSGIGIDLFTTNAASTIGYSGTESYTEAGYTGSTYGKTLSVTPSAACALATVAPSTDPTLGTIFTATAAANATNGVCTYTVGDGLTHPTAQTAPSFVVTYETVGIGASSKSRLR